MGALGNKVEKHSNAYLLVCKVYQACALSDPNCWGVRFWDQTGQYLNLDLLLMNCVILAS